MTSHKPSFINVTLIIEATLGLPHPCLSYNIYFSLKMKLATTYIGSQSKFVLICLFPFFSWQLIFSTPKEETRLSLEYPFYNHKYVNFPKLRNLSLQMEREMDRWLSALSENLGRIPINYMPTHNFLYFYF